MNLLFFIDSGFNYGVNPFLVEQIRSIHKQHNRTFAAGSLKELENNLIDSLRQDNIGTLSLDGMEKHQNFKTHVKQLSEYILTYDINIVHAQTNWQLALLIITRLYLLFNKHRFNIIYTIHAYRNNEYRLKSFLARMIIGTMLFFFVDKIICTSSFLVKKFRLLKYKIVQIPLGVSQSFFGPYKECNTDHLRIVFPAQFRTGKNQDILIKAFSEYIKETSDYTSSLCLPGDGALLEKMKSLVQSFGIEKQVIFPGQCPKEKIRLFYEESNIAIIPSNSETFGLCIVEPYVLGRCIITRHVGVADDIIKNDINGYFFNNTEDLKEILIKIASNKNNLKLIGWYNFEHRDNFNWDSIATRYLKFIKAL